MTHSRYCAFAAHHLCTLALSGAAIACIGNSAHGQITPDTTLGAESSVVTPIDAQRDQIDGGATRGANLFHSFQEFNIGVGRSAYFTNPAGIQNILTRVTGSNPSNIFGTLGVLGDANLFFLNPNGIIFGPNARLDIRNSFVATTASSLNFAERSEFSATNPTAPPLLTINVPIGLQLGETPKSIVNQSQAIDSNGNPVGLQVPTGKTLALVGGDIALDGGYLSAPQGRIELTSAIAHRVSLVNSNGQLSLGGTLTTGQGDIQLSGGAVVDTSGTPLIPPGIGGMTEENFFIQGGNIQVQGRRVRLADGSQIRANTQGSQPGGSLIVRAQETVELIGASQKPNGEIIPSGLFAQTTGPGSAGTLTVETGQLIARDGGQVSTSTFGGGNAGNVTVKAQEVTLNGRSPEQTEPSGLLARVEGTATGNGGVINISSDRLNVTNGARIAAANLGQGQIGGRINIQASESVSVTGTAIGGNPTQISALTTGAGAAGDLNITTRELIAQEGGQVSTSTFGGGNAGNVTVKAQEVTLNGRSPDETEPSGLLARVEKTATGNGGIINIRSDRLNITNGARIAAANLGQGQVGGKIDIQATESVSVTGTAIGGNPTQISALTTGVGAAGDLRITTRQLITDSGGQISTSTFGSGNAGNLTVNAQGVTLNGRSADRTEPSGLLARVEGTATGNGGVINISSDRLNVTNGARIAAANLGQGQVGGRINIQASESVTVTGTAIGGNPTQISALTTGAGAAGDLSITTRELIAQEGGQVSTSTFGAGNAGNVTVKAQEVTLNGRSPDGSGASGLQARVEGTATGNAGNVRIETDRLRVRDGARVAVASLSQVSLSSANTQPQAQAGKLTVIAEEVELIGVGKNANGESVASGLSALSISGKGGNIELQTRDVLLRGGGEISAISLGDRGDGNIQIRTQTIVLLEASRVLTDVRDPQGGNIQIRPLPNSDLVVLRSPDSVIRASGELIFEGEVEVKTPDIPPVELTDVTSLIDRRCAREELEGSEFIITGKGGIPPSPLDLLTNDALVVNWIPLPESKGVGDGSPAQSGGTQRNPPDSGLRTSLEEAQGWVIGPNGEVILTAEASKVTPHSSGLAIAHCPPFSEDGRRFGEKRR